MYRHIAQICPLVMVPLVYIVYGILNTYLLLKVILTFRIMTDNVQMGFFIFARFIRREIRFGWTDGIKKRYKTSMSLRQMSNLTKYYRALHILMGLTIEAIGAELVVGHILMLQLSVFIQLILLTYYDKLSVLNRVLFVMSWIVSSSIWVFSLDMFGRVLSASQKTIGSWMKAKIVVWDSHKDFKYFKRFRKSCKPLMLNVENVYLIQRSTVLKFLKWTSQGTIRGILTIRNF